MTAAELRALLAKATPGPWDVEVEEYGNSGSVCVNGLDRLLHDTDWADPEDFERDQVNAALIVALRNNAERFAELLRREEAAVVASGATTEPVSDPYKLHWAWYGNDHVYLTAELEIVGVVHLPQSGSCIEYPWRCGSVVGTALCIGDARAAVEDAVRAGR